MKKQSFQQILECIDESVGETYNYKSINDFFCSKSNDITSFMNKCQENLTTMLRDTLTYAKNKLQLCIDIKKLENKLPKNPISTLQPVLDPVLSILGQNGRKSLVNTALNEVGNLLTKIISTLTSTNCEQSSADFSSNTINSVKCLQLLNTVFPELQNILKGIENCLGNVPQIDSLLNIPVRILNLSLIIIL